MAKNSISQLDLVLLGGRGLTARLNSVESSVKRLSIGSDGDTGTVAEQPIRPNLFTNSSYEFYDRGSTKPQDWVSAGTAVVSVGSTGCDGTNTMRLTNGASVEQKAAAALIVPHASIVVSVAARTDSAGQKVALSITHAPGFETGPMMRIDQGGQAFPSDDLPNDGQWYRFYRAFILTGGAFVQATIAQAGATGTVEIDAAKFEKEDGQTSWLEPTAYIAADWGAATHIRNLAAENIVTGTLVVGGSTATNPRISVKDGSDIEIVTIGDPTGGFYGIEIKQAAGLRVSGSGSVEVLGGGSIKVKGGGGVDVEGGIVQVSGTGLIRAGTAGAQRTELNASGLSSYSAANVELVRLDTADGVFKVLAPGGMIVSGGSVTVDNNGEMVVTGTGRFRAGSSDSYRAELYAGGLALFKSATEQTILLSSITGKVHVFDDSLVMENGGKLSYVSGLVWSDNQGFWAIDNVGTPSFAVNGVDGKNWAGVTLDKGDVMMGTSTNYVWWDASTGALKINGQVVVGVTNKLWLNDSNDGSLAIGGTVKASAPFRVSAAGALVATNATLSGTVTSGVVSMDPSFGLRITARSIPYYSYSEPANTGIKWMLNPTTPLASLEAWRDTVENYRYVTLKADYAGTNVLQFISNDTISLSTGTGGSSLTLGSAFLGIQTSSNLTFFGSGGITLGYASGTGGLTVWSDAGIYSYGNINAFASASPNNHPGAVQCDGWFRSYGQSGWYNESFNVGWYSNAAGMIRNYANARLKLQFAGDQHVHLRDTLQVLQTGVNNGGAIYFGQDTDIGTQYTGGIETSWGNTTNPRLVIGVTRDGAKANQAYFYDNSMVIRQGATNRLRMGINGNISIGTGGTDVSWNLTMLVDSAAKPNGGSWTNASSDIRTKAVLGEYEYGLEAIRKLRLVRYEYNGKGGTVEGLRGVGFVAQEAQQVIPEMIQTRMAKLNEDDEHETELLALNNDPAIYATMKAVQEMAEIIDQLRAEIAELRGSK